MNIKWSLSIPIRILLILMSAIGLYPIVFTFFTSLKSTEEFYSNLWSLPSRLSFENYVQAFDVGRLGEYFFNSVVIAVMTLLVVNILGIFAAYALARLHVPLSRLIITLLLIIQILPTESMIIPLYILLSKLNLLSMIYIPISIVYIGWLLPVTIIILWNFFLTIPVELMESARIDGCGELSTMSRIAFPLSGPAVATVTVLNVTGIWGELMWAQIATLSTDKGIPLTVGLLNFQGQYQTNWGLLTAAICMIIIPLIIIFIFLQKYFIQGLTAGAVKG